MKQLFHDTGTLMATIILASLASTAAAQQTTGQGKHDREEVEQVIQDWKQQPRQVAQKMIEKYGVPQEVTSQRLIWHDNGPWKRTELLNEEIDHDFPMPHKDMLMQVVSYEVPADKFDELAEYDGSVIVERTRGELAARCDKEAANFLALNLAHDIITDEKSVEEAREEYGDQIVAMASGESAPLTKELTFQPEPDAGDADRTTLDPSTVKQVKQQMQAMK